jgi:hypothetical protein
MAYNVYDVKNRLVPPLLVVSLSMVLVTCGQLQSENIKWKIPEVNNS